MKKDYEQKFDDAYAKTDVSKTDILTPEQKKAGDDARKVAKEAGKKGKELTQAVADAEKVTDEQKAKLKDADKPKCFANRVQRQGDGPSDGRAKEGDRRCQTEEGQQARQTGRVTIGCKA